MLKDWIMKTFLKRYVKQTPWALRGITILLGVTTVVCGLPVTLDYMCTSQEICLLEHLPEFWKVLSNKIISISCAVGMFLTELGVKEDSGA